LEIQRVESAMIFEFNNIQNTLSALQAPIRQNFTERSYNQLRAVSFTLSSVHYLMTNGMAGPMGLAGGFNALDGD
ncbi:MAG: hypothetical protein AAFN16_22720, partial [Pseudomonadota bacterium]